MCVCLSRNSSEWQAQSTKCRAAYFVCVSAHLCTCRRSSGIRAGRHRPALSLLPPCLPRAGLPCLHLPSLSSANVHGVAIPFIIPSKFSLFPSLSFMISTVSSETDGQSLPISLCQRQPHLRSGGSGAGRTAPIPYAAPCPHIEICHG